MGGGVLELAAGHLGPGGLVQTQVYLVGFHHTVAVAILASQVGEGRHLVDFLHIHHDGVWALGFVAAPGRMPERAGIVVEGQFGLVATLVTVGADQCPAGLVDIEGEGVVHLRTVHQALSRTVGCHLAGIVVEQGSGVFLIFPTVDTVIDCGVLGRCCHLDAASAQAFATHGLTNGHVDAGCLGCLDTGCQGDDEETEGGIGGFQLVFRHHIRTA